MPKRGERLEWRVAYTYPVSDRAPKGIKAREAKSSAEDAFRLARQIASRGGTAVVWHVDRPAETRVFGPTEED